MMSSPRAPRLFSFLFEGALGFKDDIMKEKTADNYSFSFSSRCPQIVFSFFPFSIFIKEKRILSAVT